VECYIIGFVFAHYASGVNDAAATAIAVTGIAADATGVAAAAAGIAAACIDAAAAGGTAVQVLVSLPEMDLDLYL
jgi:hypothetical protein